MFTTLIVIVMMNMIMEMSLNSQDPALFMSAYLHLLVCLHKEMRCGCTDVTGEFVYTGLMAESQYQTTITEFTFPNMWCFCELCGLVLPSHDPSQTTCPAVQQTQMLKMDEPYE